MKLLTDPFPHPPVGLPVTEPHGLKIGARVLILHRDGWQNQEFPPTIAFVNSYTKSTVRTVSLERRNYSYPDRCIYFKSKEWEVYEALEGADRWLRYVEAYTLAMNCLRKFHLRTGDPSIGEAIHGLEGRFIPPAMAEQLDQLRSWPDNDTLREAVNQIVYHYTGAGDLAERHRRVTETLRRIRDDLNTLLGE